MKSNGLNNKLNDGKIFKMFEMEMDYLSEIAWEGLKCGQAIISCEIQQKVLHMIKNIYPYYLMNCLYELNESKEHEQVYSILMNEQLTPRYSVMIPFMCAILYNNIISKKDPSGSGLLYFWKLLHLSLPQIVPIHQMMLFMHCLDACKADTDSSFLSSQLQICHKSLVDSFKPWIISWIHFDKDKDYAYEKNMWNDYKRILDKPLDKLMELHLLISNQMI
ncbi:hypothetical protein RFI_28665 [Reticulomyxa filosa]|uniref:Uncharacterized protein n=1 Tax=Reticulomyxa filosa TaxID=46433 RepID=X6M412_RETFI|nr:hypothetical protein RFI_28665 [Reticulomyxa filosa]|eukprot:ETO08723.1 hypothetical protein RFI_28665 [Reticulomyxa filosa]